MRIVYLLILSALFVGVAGAIAKFPDVPTWTRAALWSSFFILCAAIVAELGASVVRWLARVASDRGWR